jgi:hypothetical protein
VEEWNTSQTNSFDHIQNTHAHCWQPILGVFDSYCGLLVETNGWRVCERKHKGLVGWYKVDLREVNNETEDGELRAGI